MQYRAIVLCDDTPLDQADDAHPNYQDALNDLMDMRKEIIHDIAMDVADGFCRDFNTKLSEYDFVIQHIYGPQSFD